MDINKNKVFDIIKQNIDLFIKRLGLNERTNITAIYKRLADALMNRENISDLEGVTFGIPKYNAMIYTLEKTCGLNAKDRKDENNFKQKLIEALHSKESPYANFDEQFIGDLQNAIEKIGKINFFQNEIYDFVLYTDEPAEMQRIAKSTEKYIKTRK